MDVLLIDDNPDDRALSRRALEAKFASLKVHEVGSPASFESVLASGTPDLAVTDYQLHWSDGLRVLKALKTRHPSAPVIMFTGTGTEEVAVAAMKSGLDDYLIKTADNYRRLPIAVEAALERTAMRRQVAEAQEQLRVAAELLKRAGKAARVGAFLDARRDDGRVVWSDAMYELLGVSPEAAITPELALEICAPSVRPFVIEALRRMRSDGRPLTLELPLAPAVGRSAWVRIYVVPTIVEGRAVEFSGAVQDISREKELEFAVVDAANTERQRLAEELHDDLGQILAGAKLHAHALAKRLSGEALALQEQAQRIEDILDVAHNECRAIARMHAQSLAPSTLRAALESLVDFPAGTLRGSVRMAAQLPDAVGTYAATELYRIAQEAVSNAVSHSQCSLVEITVEVREDRIQLTVEDDGLGIVAESAARASPGMGLSSMRARAARLGGILDIQNRTPVGTRILVEIPGVGPLPR
jgi:signal transduction histidine kinase